jgi:hypothetical protein
MHVSEEKIEIEESLKSFRSKRGESLAMLIRAVVLVALIILFVSANSNPGANAGQVGPSGGVIILAFLVLGLYLSIFLLFYRFIYFCMKVREFNLRLKKVLP